MDIQIDSKMLKSPAGIAVAVVVAVAALGFVHWRRNALIEQGTKEVQRYLELELPSRYMRESNGQVDPQVVEKLRKVEVLSLEPSWLFKADRHKRVRVKTVIRDGSGKTSVHYFKFKSVLGSWKLHSETAPPLWDHF